MENFLPKASACEHQGLLFIFAVRDDAAFLSVRKVSTSQQPTQLHSYICLQLFVLIVMGSVRSADFVPKALGRKLQGMLFTFPARGDGALDLAG